MNIRKQLPAALLCLALVMAINPGMASADESIGTSAGVGFASALSSLVYGPTKVVYAILGGVFGGFAWALSGGNNDVASAVLTPAVRGDYVVTPANIRGEEPLEFFGREPAYTAQPAAVASPGPY